MERPRSLIIEPGAMYHVASRGTRRTPIYLDDFDRRFFLRLLRDVVSRNGWICHAYCLMGNHYHLLLTTPQANLSDGMYRLNRLHAVRFNGRHDLVGHVFEGRYFGERIEGAAHLLELCRYIVLNPVRAHLCGHPTAWPWSSFIETSGRASRTGICKTEWLLAQFSPNAERARELYAAFVADGITARAA
jgi:REP element-mobilizing transposase RayT